jgi:hypothetical protein
MRTCETWLSSAPRFGVKRVARSRLIRNLLIGVQRRML